MSRFKRTKIKSSKKSSVSIDEKIAALNQELEKTGMSNVSEMMTTDDVYSTSTYVPPTDSSEAEVPDPDPDNGITSGDDWTQPLGNDESGNPASSPPTSFPRIWNNPGYSDPTDGLLNKSDLHGDGAALPIYNLPDWQDPADVPAGGVGGMQIELGGMDPGIVGGYLDANGFQQTTGKLGGVTFKTHPELFQPVKYWRFFSIYNPFIDSYWPNNSLGRTPQYQGIVKGTEDGSGGAPMALFTAYMYTGGGRAKYNINGNPPGSKDPIRRGTEDEPIYPGPIANFFGLGERAFEWLKKKAEEWWNDLKNQNYSGGGKPNQPGSGFPDSKPEPDPTEPDPKPKPDPTGGYTPTPQGGKGGGQGNPTNQPGSGFPDPKPKPDPTGGYTPTPQGGKGGGQGNPTNQPGSGTQTQTQTQTQTSSTSTEPDPTEKTYEKNRKNNRPDVQGYDPADLKKEFDKYTSILGNPAVDSALDAVADKVGGKAAKDTVDDYTRDFVPDLVNGKKPPGSSKDNPRDMSKVFDDKTIEKWEDIFKDHQETGEKIPYSYQATADTDNNIGSSFGTPDKLVGDGFEDNGDGTTTWHKAFDFDGFDDLAPQTGDLLMNVGTALYGTLSGLHSMMALPGSGKAGKTPTMHMGITFDNKTGKVIPNYKPGSVKESYITESVRLGFFEPKIMDVNLADIKSGIMPEYPKKPPAEMIDGYHEKSRIRPREAKNIIPTLKIDKVDLIRNHRLKPSEADEMMNTIKMINDYIKENPADFVHAQMRYPKDDPRLAELNWKMDQMLGAGKEYMDSNFKVNQTLFKRATDRTKKNTALTNPDYIQKHYDELRGTIKPESKPTINRKSPSRFFKKPKKKSSMEAINDKIKQLDKDLLI